MLLNYQSTRLDDQRGPMPKSGANLGQHEPSLFGAGDSKLDEEFFDMVVLMQGSRLEDQRSPAAADKKHVIDLSYRRDWSDPTSRRCEGVVVEHRPRPRGHELLRYAQFGQVHLRRIITSPQPLPINHRIMNAPWHSGLESPFKQISPQLWQLALTLPFRRRFVFLLVSHQWPTASAPLSWDTPVM